MDDDARMAVFLDYENLALGARDHLGGMTFDFGPIADALAVRGRSLTRRAYADWSYFDEDRRMLTRHQFELIEIPQRMGASRKNAADIKMVVDAIEMAFERDYVSTFVLCTGDSDFSPLVHKLRELDKRVIGVGVELSTSRLLPPACDEFLFYDRLEGVEPGDEAPRRRGAHARGPAAQARHGAQVVLPSGSGTGAGSSVAGGSGSTAKSAGGAGAGSAGGAGGTSSTSGGGAGTGQGGTGQADSSGSARVGTPDDDTPASPSAVVPAEDADGSPDEAAESEPIEVRVAQTLAGLASTADSVTASVLKRALLRKDPTFSESDLGFRSFGEVLRHLAGRGVVDLSPGPATGDPEVSLPDRGSDLEDTFDVLVEIVAKGDGNDDGAFALSGLKNRLRKERPEFSEKALGYRSFLQFVRGAEAGGHVELEWDDEAGDYLVTVPEG
ncbi:NYN domain-containing protein [Georgenia sp. Z1344]|uniref:NYN domain-containing protein n=1 Tax=Georgenia sp. Z1344 TaxID=3416706 RepID=UPI003CEA672B